jgi:hypothetical protein
MAAAAATLVEAVVVTTARRSHGTDRLDRHQLAPPWPMTTTTMMMMRRGGAKTVRARRHNNQPSDSIEGEEEMLMEGDVAMEAETAFSMELSVGVVLQKI